MLLTHLADYIQQRKDKKNCIFCSYVAKSEKELDKHIYDLHPEQI
jgi:hypothetical protein